ncbi:MAG: ABC transporter permease [Bdellovibrionaceae bacterium]|nr:ABC transporter permease [Pseudobdellovibrionaceae bacterium]MDW8189844.1 ABC transporter permease [Pseudobdellovibrionaceae bacterium]
MMWQPFFTFFSFAKDCIADIFRPPFRTNLLFKEMELITYQSLPIVTLCLSFAATVTILESSFHMKMVIGDDALVPGFAAVLILREIGAIVTALLIVARAGAAMTAEIALKLITEQIDALKMIGIRPYQFLVAPKIVASSLGVAMLSMLVSIVALVVCGVASHIYLDLSPGLFLAAFHRFANFNDLFVSGFKGFIFGFTIPLICCFFGFQCRGGAEHVGKMTTRGVVMSSIVIIILDFLLSALISHLF